MLITFTIFTNLNVQFSYIKYIHNIVLPSPLSTSKTFCLAGYIISHHKSIPLDSLQLKRLKHWVSTIEFLINK